LAAAPLRAGKTYENISPETPVSIVLAALFNTTYAMPSGMTNRSFDTAPRACAARLSPPLAVFAALFRQRPFKSCLRTTLAAVTMSVALSGCGVFCGGAGGSGGGFAGGCATGVRF
jgi:hypothetical protein